MECYTSARNIPANWDSMSGDNLYMKRNFLSFIEQSDPCEQKYYIFRKCNKKLLPYWLLIQDITLIYLCLHLLRFH